MTNKEKFLALVSEDTSNTAEWIRERQANRKFYRTSQKIALNILKRLSELSWTQKELAEKMEVSPQQVHKWVKGGANFKLDTLVHLGTVLGVDLIQPKALSENIENIRLDKREATSSFYKKENMEVAMVVIKTGLIATNTEEHYPRTKRLA